MQIRKIVTVIDETITEGGREVQPAARTAVVAAVIEKGFVEDLAPGIDATASDLGALLAPKVLEALGAPAEAYGKAAIVGLDGEIEHGSALIHTLKFGDHFRKAANATTLLPLAPSVVRGEHQRRPAPGRDRRRPRRGRAGAAPAEACLALHRAVRPRRS